jgi:(+)-beta-caryophyllene/(+)-caryolan-1-ol synthase
MTHSTLPVFYMPFQETGVNPWLDDANEELWKWIDAMQLAPGRSARSHVERTNPALLAARFYPTAERRMMPLLAEFCAWGFIIDDEFDEGAYGRDSELCAKAVSSLLTVFKRGAAVNASPLEVALFDLWDRLVQCRSAGWRRQLANNIKGWLVTYHRAALERESGYVPGVEEFQEYRQFAVGMHMFMDLAEIVAAADLPDQVRYSSALLDMRRAVAEHVAFLNDIFSARKESGHDFGYNLVLITEQVQQCGIEAAIDRANDIVSGVINNFMDARQRLYTELSTLAADWPVTSAALRYADALKAVVRGNYDWHFESERYTHPAELGSGYPDYISDLFACQPRRSAAQ